MIKIRKAIERGHVRNDWLSSAHTFSFGSYYDPKHTSFESLRVINDDHIKGGGGFATHSHDNMEIITYVLTGALAHKDSMGNEEVIKAGEVQRMSAGTGISHSEYNHSQSEEVHLLQIWFLPDQQNVTPGYEQKYFSEHDKTGKFCLVASKQGRDGSVSLHQDMDMSVALLDSNQEATYQIKPNRNVWAHLARGSLELNGQKLSAGDGAAITDETLLKFSNAKQAEIILFDMARI